MHKPATLLVSKFEYPLMFGGICYTSCMRFLLKTYPSEASAKMAQGLLESNDIESVITPGRGGAATMSVVTTLDRSYQLFIRDCDREKAETILEIKD